MQHVQHCLHRRASQFTTPQFFLNGLYIPGPGLLQNILDLQLQWRERRTRFSAYRQACLLNTYSRSVQSGPASL